jgi:hypothetical protein
MAEAVQNSGPAQSQKQATPKLRESQIARIEQRRTTYHADVPAGVAYENLLKPEFWAHVAQKLRPGDFIFAEAEDGTFIAELYVRNAGHNWATVFEIMHHDFEELTSIGDETIPGFEIKWRGRVQKHVVVRLSDGQIMTQGLSLKQEAVAWLADYAKSLKH